MNNSDEIFLNEKKNLLEIRNKYLSYPKPGVTIITPTNKPCYLENILQNYFRCNYPNIELIIIFNSNSFNIDKYKQILSKTKNISIYQLDETVSLGDCLNAGVIHSSYEYIAKMDDDDYYGANYIGDLMNIFNYTDADFVGKTSHFIYFENNNLLGVWYNGHENMYVNAVAGSTFLIKKYIFNSIKFNSLNASEDCDFIAQYNSLGLKIYSGDKFNYVYNRHFNIDNHSWKIDNDKLINVAEQYCTTNDYSSFISI